MCMHSHAYTCMHVNMLGCIIIIMVYVHACLCVCVCICVLHVYTSLLTNIIISDNYLANWILLGEVLRRTSH